MRRCPSILPTIAREARARVPAIAARFEESHR